jgi:predicted  nucleic acid-binding Zn-ribbon protein
MASKKQINTWIRQIERKRDEVGKLRDKIREMADEINALEECCERAWDDLHSAIDALSELA